MAACIASASPTPRRALVSKYPTAPVSVKGGGEERKKGRGGKRERERKVGYSVKCIIKPGQSPRGIFTYLSCHLLGI